MRQAVRSRPSPGFTLIELLIGVAIVSILAAIAIPHLLAAQQRSRYARAACDSKTAVTQSIVYAGDHSRNPGSMQALRESGYVNVRDTDPWGQPWIYSPVFADTGTPAPQGEMGVCSTGAQQTGACDFPLLGPVAPQPNGSVGYSSLYGAWQGATAEQGAALGTATSVADAAGADPGAGGDPASRGRGRGNSGHPNPGNHGRGGQ